MAYKKIRTQSINVTEDFQFLADNYPGIMDMAFVNNGTSNCQIQPEGGVIRTLEPGDPLLTWGGYENYYRNDNINITFTGGTGELLIEMTIHQNFDPCKS